MALDGNMIVALCILIFVGWLVFFYLPIPQPLRMFLASVVAVALVLWSLTLMGVVHF